MENGNSFGGVEQWSDDQAENFEQKETIETGETEERFRPNGGEGTVNLEAEIENLPVPDMAQTTSEIMSGTVLDQEGRMVVRERTEGSEKSDVEEAQRSFAETWPDADTAYGKMQEIRRKTWAANGYFGGEQ